jgi:hypothetical protein
MECDLEGKPAHHKSNITGTGVETWQPLLEAGD